MDKFGVIDEDHTPTVSDQPPVKKRYAQQAPDLEKLADSPEQRLAKHAEQQQTQKQQ